MDSYKILDGFGFGTDRAILMRGTCLLVSHRHTMMKMLSGRLRFYFIFIKLSDEKDRHKMPDKFDLGSLPTIGMRVTCT